MSGTTRITCGTFGGINSRGEPCGIASVDGPCTRHVQQVADQEAERRQMSAGKLDPDFGFKVPPFRRLKDNVAIVGFTDHRVEALELDDSWELWGLNELYRYMPPDRFTRWFEIHDRDYLTKDEDGQKHIEDLKLILGKTPIYMQHHHADIPGSVMYPKDGVIAKLGRDYSTNCPSMMIQFAMTLGYKKIHMYGVDMAQETEHAFQRPCCEYWLGRAEGMGIEVAVPEVSDLMKCIGVYGYKDEGNLLSAKLEERLAFLHKQDNAVLAQLRKLDAEYKQKHAAMSDTVTRQQGAVIELKTWRQTARIKDRLTGIEAEIASMGATLEQLNDEYDKIHAQLMANRNQMVGGIQNVEYLLTRWMVKAESRTGGNIPTPEQRAADPRTGIQAPSGDSAAKTPSAVTAGV